MSQVDSDLLLRIDAFLGLLGFSLIIATFYLMAVNLIIGLVCLVIITLAASAGIKGYRDSAIDVE